MQKVPVFVNNRSFPVDDVGENTPMNAVHHLLQSIVFVKAVARIQKTEIVAAGKGNRLVHGIVQSFVRFADDGSYPWTVSVDDRESTVFGGPVHDDVFYVVVSLRDNTLDGIFQYFLGIVGHRDNRELGSRMDTMHISLLFCCKRPCTSSL